MTEQKKDATDVATSGNTLTASEPTPVLVTGRKLESPTGVPVQVGVSTADPDYAEKIANLKRKGKGITVVSRSMTGHRRAGIVVGPSKTFIPHDRLTNEQFAALSNDSDIIIFEGDEADEASGAKSLDYALPVNARSNEPATDEMIAAASKGEYLPHPAAVQSSNFAANQAALAEQAAKATGGKPETDKAAEKRQRDIAQGKSEK